MPADINRMTECEALSPVARHFATLMERLSGEPNREVWLAAAGLSELTTTRGHVCLDFRRPQILFETIATGNVPVPTALDWMKALRRSKVVGKPGEFRPMIFDGMGRLYLHRFWRCEMKLAEAIRRRLVAVPVDEARLRADLLRYFPAAAEGETDWQKVAALAALTRKFCVISGGPGTGKTTTVLKILALALAQRPKLRIALAAPTGKAASRLQESVAVGKALLPGDESVKARLPESASTIHRLLGRKLDSAGFRYTAENPLPLDLLVVDEAGMVDLVLMSKLFDALPADAGIILLGDRHQLASVEAGAVFADICGEDDTPGFSPEFRATCQRLAGEHLPGIAKARADESIRDSIIELQRNYRFAEAANILVLSDQVRRGETDAALALLQQSREDVSWQNISNPAEREAALQAMVLEGFGSYLSARDPVDALERFNHFRILTALREGPTGVRALNSAVERILAEAGKIDCTQAFYAGRPLMITRNDYDVNLFNGDVGLVWPDRASGDLRVFFMGENNSLKNFLPLRLPSHQTVFATTIHKSQGSEFERLLMLLPERDSPVLTRELIYTGLTRAKKSVTLWGSEQILASALARKTERASGLNDLLWKARS